MTKLELVSIIVSVLAVIITICNHYYIAKVYKKIERRQREYYD